jgi:hypothetical protein
MHRVTKGLHRILRKLRQKKSTMHILRQTKCMKTFLYLTMACALLTGIAANAQIQKGSFRVGGTARYSHSKSDNDQTFDQLSFSPSIAYFPVKHFSVGVTLPLALSEGKGQTYTYSSTSYRLGPELRYYFPFANWAIFPEVAMTFGKTVTKNDYRDGNGDPVLSKYEVKFRSFAPGFGVTCFLNRNVAIEGIMRYTNNSETATSPFSPAFDRKELSFNVGFQIYLHAKD